VLNLNATDLCCYTNDATERFAELDKLKMVKLVKMVKLKMVKFACKSIDLAGTIFVNAPAASKNTTLSSKVVKKVSNIIILLHKAHVTRVIFAHNIAMKRYCDFRQ